MTPDATQIGGNHYTSKAVQPWAAKPRPGSVFTRATRWLATIRNGHSELGKVMDDDGLTILFHANDAAGRPMDRQPPIPPEME